MGNCKGCPETAEIYELGILEKRLSNALYFQNGPPGELKN